MSLFGALQISTGALNAHQLALQVISNNVSNANTPGYIRQRIDLEAAPPARIGNITYGLGVKVAGVTQLYDKFLAERILGASSNASEGETLEAAYTKLETLIGELSDTDLSTSLSKFFNSIQDVLNQPESRSVRNLVQLQGQSLSTEIRALYGRVETARNDLDEQVRGTADQINSLLEKIADLNIKVAAAEGGVVGKSDAVGIRDERAKSLDELAKLIEIRTSEQPTGDITVFIGGEYLISQGTRREVKAFDATQGGYKRTEIRLVDTDSPITVTGGKLRGLLAARDEVMGDYLTNLDDFAQTLMVEFNKIHSSGQGLTGYSSLTSEFSVADTQKPLDEAQLPFTVQNGSFQVLTTNRQTGLTTTRDIRVDLNGLDADDSLATLVTAINDVDGISAVATPDRRLQITSDTPNVSFSFANDTSGALAALGVNTFFSGRGARDIAVATAVKSDPAKFAASKGGLGIDAHNAEALAQLLNTPLASRNGNSLAVVYDRMNSDVAQGSSVTKSLAAGYRTFQQSLESQQAAISGVSIDEEIANMMAHQRAFQASARVIATIDEMLEILVNI